MPNAHAEVGEYVARLDRPDIEAGVVEHKEHHGYPADATDGEENAFRLRP